MKMYWDKVSIKYFVLKKITFYIYSKKNKWYLIKKKKLLS